jgi:hypothetical protein
MAASGAECAAQVRRCAAVGIKLIGLTAFPKNNVHGCNKHSAESLFMEIP